jgi:sortase B
MVMKKKILIAFGSILVIAGVVIGGIGLKNYLAEKHAGKLYEELKVDMDIEPIIKLPTASVEQMENPIDFDSLTTQYPDIYAWIRIPGTRVDYPIVQREGDNGYYLNHTIDGKKKTEGSIYTEDYNSKDFGDANTVIYGHNMKNGSMFGQLRKYKSESFYQEHPFFYIYTPDGKELKYQIFAVGIVEDRDETFRSIYVDDGEFLRYVEHLQKISPYKTGVEVTAEDTIVSLSTCTNVTETQRLVVHGVKIGEKVAGE